MAATSLTIQEISLTGITPTYTAANADGNYFSGSGKEFLIVKNGGASAITVTVTSQQECNQGELHHVTVSVDASGEKWIGPFDKDRFNDTDGYVQVSYSDVSNVTVAVVRLP